jgi:hypothetical protein
MKFAFEFEPMREGASVREIKADKQCANLGYAREISSQNHALD